MRSPLQSIYPPTTIQLGPILSHSFSSPVWLCSIVFYLEIVRYSHQNFIWKWEEERGAFSRQATWLTTARTVTVLGLLPQVEAPYTHLLALVIKPRLRLTRMRQSCSSLQTVEALTNLNSKGDVFKNVRALPPRSLSKQKALRPLLSSPSFILMMLPSSTCSKIPTFKFQGMRKSGRVDYIRPQRLGLLNCSFIPTLLISQNKVLWPLYTQMQPENTVSSLVGRCPAENFMEAAAWGYWQTLVFLSDKWSIQKEMVGMSGIP